MTLTKNAKRTAAARTSGPHRTRPTRRSVHRNQEQGTRNKESGDASTGSARTRERVTARPSAQNGALITIDRALLAEIGAWTVLAGASLAAWLTAAIAIGVV
jgi:hypothetical protein